MTNKVKLSEIRNTCDNIISKARKFIIKEEGRSGVRQWRWKACMLCTCDVAHEYKTKWRKTNEKKQSLIGIICASGRKVGLEIVPDTKVFIICIQSVYCDHEIEREMTYVILYIFFCFDNLKNKTTLIMFCNYYTNKRMRHIGVGCECFN